MKKVDIAVKGTIVYIVKQNNADYISLTDMARFKDPERSDYILQNWMRLRSTIDFIGLWETLHNPNFKSIEFDGFKNQAGSNSFSLTPKRWIEATNAIGIISKSGRYGGTYAHNDIAFEFASWISAEFKLYLIKEFQTTGTYKTTSPNGLRKRSRHVECCSVWHNCKAVERCQLDIGRKYPRLCDN